jgi:hypothetical protein
VPTWIRGSWTYRSFFNEVDKGMLAEGQLTFEAAPDGAVRGQLAFRSDPPRSDDPRLTLAGSLESGPQQAIRFQGVGVQGTRAETWIYDYIAFHVPDWPAGHNQRDAFVGSVTRTVAHKNSQGGMNPAGQVFSFVAFRNEFPEPRNVIPLPAPVRDMLASRHHRLHHLVWHSTRNLWLNPAAVTEDNAKRITELGWAPPRPAVNRFVAPLVNNGSGQDFLFMHRQMLAEVNTGVKAAGGTPIASWKTIPAPGPVASEPQYDIPHPTLPPAGNPDGYSVPPPWYSEDEVTNQRLRTLKSDDFFWSRMRWWDRQFKDASYLSTLTLEQLGALIEWSVHNDMHMRWASIPRSEEGLPTVARPDWDIRANLWDRPQYDHLGEQYSSHVNPVFWRLHGWVDDRIEDWFAAHEQSHKGEIERIDLHAVSWFKGRWVMSIDPWTGPAMDMVMNGHHDMGRGAAMDPVASDDDSIRKMEAVIATLFPPPSSEGLAFQAEAQPSPATATVRRFSTF